MHKAQGINSLCTAQLNLPLTEAALITEKLMNWSWSNIYCPVWVTLHCSKHSAHVSFSPCNVSLLSTFIAARLLAGSLSLEKMGEFHHTTGSEAFGNPAPTSVRKVFCVSSSQRISSFITITFPVALWVTWWKQNPKLQARFKNTQLQCSCDFWKSLTFPSLQRIGMGGNSEPRDLPKTAWDFSFWDSLKMLHVKQKLPKAVRGSCQEPELKAPVWVAQGCVCTQAAKASTLVHAS